MQGTEFSAQNKFFQETKKGFQNGIPFLCNKIQTTLRKKLKATILGMRGRACFCNFFYLALVIIPLEIPVALSSCPIVKPEALNFIFTLILSYIELTCQ